MAKNFHNGTNIIAKHDTIFLGEEILEFFIAPTVKTHLSVQAQKIPALQPGAKGVGDREILETYFNLASKNTSETDIFPYGTKPLLTSVINKTRCSRKSFALPNLAPRTSRIQTRTENHQTLKLGD